MAEPVTIIATQHAKPGRRDDLQAQIRLLAAAARAEAGCLEYRVAVAQDNEDTFVFVERWATREALDAHFHTEAFQAFWNTRMQYLTQDVEIVVASDFV
jgi:quinol monooxygenase YgiN